MCAPTFATHGKPGVWFFSLDAANSLAVVAARAWFHLPYFQARMTCHEQASGGIEYASTRTHHRAALAEFRANYRATGSVFHPQPGTREHFLTERYCLFSLNSRAQILVGEIHHPPWPLQSAEAQFAINTMSAQLGIPLDTAPMLHFAKRQDVVVWPPLPA